MLHFRQYEETKELAEAYTENAYLGREPQPPYDSATLKKSIKRRGRWIDVTFYLPHITGIASLLAFIMGSLFALNMISAGA
jgi:hypothetical protein